MALCASSGLDCGTGGRRIPTGPPEERWPQAVSSYGIDDDARLLLVDPLAVPKELLGLAADASRGPS